MQAGLNLFSIRNLIQTEEDFLSCAQKLKKAGYSYLQYSGAAFDAERIARVSRESGLPVCLTHVPMDRITGDTEKLMEEHARFGCRNIGLGMLPLEVLADESVCKRKLEELERAAEKMSENGFTFFYHHHHFEFFRWGSGETPFYYILNQTKHIHFVADTYWLQYAGVNVSETIDKLSGRVECVHLKDYRIAREFNEKGEAEFKPRFAVIGEGNMNFSAIIERLKKAGTEYYFVEQDDAAEYADPIGEVARSMKYIEKEL